MTSDKQSQLTWKGYHPFGAVFSPDETLIAASSVEPGGLIVWNISDGKELATLELKGLCMGLTFSPDGKLLAGAYEGGIVVWDWQAGQSRRILPGDDISMTAVAFSADGLQLAAAVGRRNEAGSVKVKIWDLASESLAAEIDSAGQSLRLLAFSPDGLRLAGGSTTGQSSTLQLWDTANGREVFSVQLPSATITAVTWSGDSRKLAAGISYFDLTASLSGRTVPASIYVWDTMPSAE